MAENRKVWLFERKFGLLGTLALGIVILSGLFAYFRFTGASVVTVEKVLGAAEKVREEEFARNHPSYDELIECTIRDVCRLVTTEARGTVDISMTASRGSDLARFFGADANITIDLIVPVVIRAGVDLENRLPDYSLTDGSLEISLNAPEVFGWHIVPENTLCITNNANHPLFYDVFELHTDLVTSIHDSVSARIEPVFDEIALEAMRRTEELLRERILELEVADEVTIAWMGETR